MGVMKKKKPIINYPPVPRKKWVPPDQRPKPKPAPKYVKPKGITQRIKPSSFKKVWHQFTLYNEIGILVANFSQSHKRFSYRTNGRQGDCNCTVACIFSNLYKMDLWNKYHLDTILILGDMLYQKSLKQNRCLKDLKLENILKTFFLNNSLKVTLTFNIPEKMLKKISCQSEDEFNADWNEIITKFFNNFSCGILKVTNQTYAIWKSDDAYFCFNPDDHNESGEKWSGIKGRGFALLARCKTLEQLILHFKTNLTDKKNIEVEVTSCSVKTMPVSVIPPNTFEEIVCIKFDPPSEMKPHECGKEKETDNEIKNDEPVAEVKEKPKELEKPPTLPPDVIKLRQKSYYSALIRNESEILQASTCQTDPNFSKYNGRQTIANAISALTMLRLYPSNIWVKRTLDTILRYGDIYFHDMMASKEKDKPVLLKNFEMKLYMEPREFQPVFEEYAAVGQLNTQESSVLDLLPALENILIDHETCIIFGPLIVAVWIENNWFYMFDPNERDGEGKVIQRTLNVGSDTVIVDKSKGFACVTRFKKLKDLVNLYMNNLEKDKRDYLFHITKVQIQDYVELPENWNNFKGCEPECWILRGTFDQNDYRFEEEHRNYQGPAISLMANAFQQLKPIKEWNVNTVDEIMINGHEYYKESIEYLKEKNLFKDKKLLISELKPHFPYKQQLILFKVDECYLNGFINAKEEQNTLNLKKAFIKFFNENDCAVVTSHKLSVAVWKSQEIYYCFDPHTRDRKGYATEYGRACVLRSKRLDLIQNIIESNLLPETNDAFNIHRVQIQLLDKTQETIKPPLQNYKSIDENIAILRSNFSECSEKYETESCKQTVPMCLTAMAFNKICIASLWNVCDLDEILDRGNDLYIKSIVQCMQNLPNTDTGQNSDEPNVGELMITSNNVRKNFSIGINNFDVEFKVYDEGNIHEKLHESLQTFFEQPITDENKNQEIILESSLLTVAMWRDDYLYYMFDSKPRGEEGQVLGKEDWTEYIPTPEDLEYFDYSEEGEYSASEGMNLGGGGDAPSIKEEETADNNEDNDNAETNENEAEGEDNEKESETKKKEEEKIIPIKRSLSYWAEQEKLIGRSCVMWFTRLDDLIGYVIENMPPVPRRELNFTLKTVHINNQPNVKNKLQPGDEPENEIAGKWNNFQEIEYGKWILRGSINLLNEMFPKSNRGKQSIPCCCVFLAFAHIYPLSIFKSSTIDKILCYGDKLFSFVKRWRRQKLLNCIGDKLAGIDIEAYLDNEKFGISDMTRKICILKNLVNFTIDIDAICGDINAAESESEPFPLNCVKGLEKFFEENNYGLFQSKNVTVAIFKDAQNIYYIFNPNSCSPNGTASINGTSCITRHVTLNDLCDIILKNLPKEGNNVFCVHKVTMSIDVCARKREPQSGSQQIIYPVVGGFSQKKPGIAILRGSTEINDEKFETTIPNDISAPIAFIALTMPFIHKVSTWSKPIVDEILMLGYELYVDSINDLGFDFNPWEDKMDIYKVKTIFNIGVVKVSAELRETEQHGVIDSKDESNLRNGISRFFEENTHGILITETYTLAIWEERESDQPTIYIFDPYSRGSTGTPMANGTACVVSFLNAHLAAEHLISCISDLEKRKGNYSLVPVEIVVGNESTRKKSKTKQTTDPKTKILRKTAEDERKRKQAKKENLIGRRQYHELSNDEAILRGLRSQFSEKYSEESRGNQDIPNCIIALVMHQIESIEFWSHKNIDQILDTGDQIYIDSYITYGPKNLKLGMENVLRKFLFDDKKVHITVYKPVVSTMYTKLANLNRIMGTFFQQEQCCLVSHDGRWATVILKGGYYYVFDPYDHDVNGNEAENGLGWAVVYKFENIDSMIRKLVTNFGIDAGNGERPFRVWLIDVDIKNVRM